MCHYWATDPDFQKASGTNKTNRSKDSGSVYVGGSISIGEHKRKFRSHDRRVIRESLPKKRDDSVDWTSGVDIARFNELMEQATQAHEVSSSVASTPDINETAIWIEATEGINKGRVSGLGNEAKATASSSSAASSPPPFQSEQPDLRREVAELLHQQEQFTVELRQQNEQMTQRHDQLVDKARDSMRSIMDRLDSFAARPVVPLTDSANTAPDASTHTAHLDND